jgi:hypothetical protein
MFHCFKKAIHVPFHAIGAISLALVLANCSTKISEHKETAPTSTSTTTNAQAAQAELIQAVGSAQAKETIQKAAVPPSEAQVQTLQKLQTNQTNDGYQPLPTVSIDGF